MSDEHSDTASSGSSDVSLDAAGIVWAQTPPPQPVGAGGWPVANDAGWNNQWGGNQSPNQWGGENAGVWNAWNEGGGWGENAGGEAEEPEEEAELEAEQWDAGGFLSDADSDTNGPQVAPDVWQAYVLSAQAIAVVLQNLSLPIDLTPNTEAWKQRGQELHLLLSTVMAVSRMWHSVALAQHALWGILLAFSPTQDIWDLLASRTGEAAVRLVYRTTLDPARLHALIPRACVIFVDDQSPWSHWSDRITGMHLPHLELLHIRPSTIDAPLSLSLPSVATVAPRLRFVNTAFPLLLDSPDVESMVLVGLRAQCVQHMVYRQHALQTLEVHNTGELDVSADWSCVLSAARFLVLRTLVVNTRTTTSFDRTAGPTYINAPALVCVETSTLVYLSAPNVHDASCKGMSSMDVRHLCSGLGNIVILRVTALLCGPAALALIQSPPLVLSCLTSLHLDDTITREFIELLRCLRLPSLKRVCVRSQYAASRDMAGMHQAAKHLSHALEVLNPQNTYQDADRVSISRRATESASQMLWQSGHGVVAHSLDSLALDQSVLSDMSCIRAASSATLRAIDAELERPARPCRHAMLRASVVALLEAVGGAADTSPWHRVTTVKIDCMADSVVVNAVPEVFETSGSSITRDGLVVTAPQAARDTFCGTNISGPVWHTRAAVLAWTLEGILPLIAGACVLSVVDKGAVMGDLTDVAHVLRGLTGVLEMRVHLVEAGSTMGVCGVLGEPGVLPGLEKITLSGKLWGGRSALFEQWWETLGQQLRARGNNGEALVSLCIPSDCHVPECILDSLRPYCDEIEKV